MPGYGILPADQDSGLLPWSWAEDRLRKSHEFWLSTVRPDGRPHLMPVWAVWDGVKLTFSSSRRSVKIRNLAAGSTVSVATDDALSPVVIEGAARIVADEPGLRRFLDTMNAKYRTDYGIDFLNPEANSVAEVTPRWAFGLKENDFSGSPTRWIFET
jgi:PPOX class probable F420-dependent enzyme